MTLYQFLTSSYNQFLNFFPPALQWVVTLLIVIGLIGAFIGLLRQNVIFLIVLILLLPFIIPVVGRLISDIYSFFVYLLRLLGLAV